MQLFIQLIIISIYSGIAYFFVQPLNNWLMLVIGLILGFLFLLFDEKLGYKYYAQNQQLGVANLSSVQNKALISRSIIFLFVFIPLSLFVITSSGSPIGVGMIISMGFIYSQELWQIINSPELFFQKYLWQTGKRWSGKEIKIFTRIFILIIILLAILALV